MPADAPEPPSTSLPEALELAFPLVGEDGGLELRINFGLFAGREATPAEIDRLGQELLARVEHVTIISERRHEIGVSAEGTLHQVVVRIDPDSIALLAGTEAQKPWVLLEDAERWARGCFAARHDPISDDLQYVPPIG